MNNEEMKNQLSTTDSMWTQQQQIEAIKKIYAANANEGEFRTFIEIGKATGLNPFLREIWLVKYGNSAAQIFVSRDGYRKVIGQNPNYLSHIVDAVYSNDEFLVDNQNGTVNHRYNITNRGVLIGAYCCVYMKTAPRPFFVFVELKEYDLKQGLWKTKPATMIKKVAECYDNETDVLTDKGFEPFDSVTGNILQVTEDGLKPTTSITFSQEYDGEMIQCDGQFLNFSVTPNHKMAIENGKIYADKLYEKATKCYRDALKIPSNCANKNEDYKLISDELLVLSAAFICDGSHTGSKQFRIAVSREYKIKKLLEINKHSNLTVKKAKNNVAQVNERKIVTLKDYQCFTYNFDLIEGICSSDKKFKNEVILNLSLRQAQLLIESLILFDGSVSNSNKRVFYTSNVSILKSVELISIIAGYTVSKPKVRFSDLSKKPNYCITISEKKYFPAVKSDTEKRGIKVIPKNKSGRVWCVTVPSGWIIVRRNGFSMVCGNSQAIRMALHNQLNGTYEPDEIDNHFTTSVHNENLGQKALIEKIEEQEVNLIPELQPEQEILLNLIKDSESIEDLKEIAEMIKKANLDINVRTYFGQEYKQKLNELRQENEKKKEQI